MKNRWESNGNSERLFFGGGGKITEDGVCNHEIKRHLLLQRKAMTNLDSILKSRDIALPTKVCLVKAMVFPVVMNACESWTIKKAEHRRIDAFELLRWKRFLTVPWTAWRSKQSKLKEIKKTQQWQQTLAQKRCLLVMPPGAEKQTQLWRGHEAWPGTLFLQEQKPWATGARASKNCHPEDNCEESLWLGQGDRFINLRRWWEADDYPGPRLAGSSRVTEKVPLPRLGQRGCLRLWMKKNKEEYSISSTIGFEG